MNAVADVARQPCRFCRAETDTPNRVTVTVDDTTEEGILCDGCFGGVMAAVNDAVVRARGRHRRWIFVAEEEQALRTAGLWAAPSGGCGGTVQALPDLDQPRHEGAVLEAVPSPAPAGRAVDRRGERAPDGRTGPGVAGQQLGDEALREGFERREGDVEIRVDAWHREPAVQRAGELAAAALVGVGIGIGFMATGVAETGPATAATGVVLAVLNVAVAFIAGRRAKWW